MAGWLATCAAWNGQAGANSTTLVRHAGYVASLGSGSSIPNSVAGATIGAMSLVGSPTLAASGGALYSAQQDTEGDGGRLTTAVSGTKHGRIQSVEALLDKIDSPGICVFWYGKLNSAASGWKTIFGSRNAAGNRGFYFINGYRQSVDSSSGSGAAAGALSLTISGAGGDSNLSWDQAHASAPRADGLWADTTRDHLFMLFIHSDPARAWFGIDGAKQVPTGNLNVNAGALSGTTTADFGVGCLYDGTGPLLPGEIGLSTLELWEGEPTETMIADLKLAARRAHRGVGGILQLNDPSGTMTTHASGTATTEGEKVEVWNATIGSSGLTNAVEAAQPSLLVATNAGRRGLWFRNTDQSADFGARTVQCFAASISGGPLSSHYTAYMISRPIPFIQDITPTNFQTLFTLKAGVTTMGGVILGSDHYTYAIRGSGSIYKPTPWHSGWCAPSLNYSLLAVGTSSTTASTGKAILVMGPYEDAVTLAGGTWSSGIDQFEICNIASAVVDEFGIYESPMNPIERQRHAAAVFASYSGESLTPARNNVMCGDSKLTAGQFAGSQCSDFTIPYDDDPLGDLGFPVMVHLIRTQARYASWVYIGTPGWTLNETLNGLLTAGNSVADDQHYDTRSSARNVVIIGTCINTLNTYAADPGQAVEALSQLGEVIAGVHAQCDDIIVIEAPSNATDYAAYNTGVAALLAAGTIDAIGPMGTIGAGELIGDNIHDFGGTFTTNINTCRAHGRYAFAELHALQQIAPNEFGRTLIGATLDRTQRIDRTQRMSRV